MRLAAQAKGGFYPAQVVNERVKARVAKAGLRNGSLLAIPSEKLDLLVNIIDRLTAHYHVPDLVSRPLSPDPSFVGTTCSGWSFHKTLELHTGQVISCRAWISSIWTQ